MFAGLSVQKSSIMKFFSSGDCSHSFFSTVHLKRKINDLASFCKREAHSEVFPSREAELKVVSGSPAASAPPVTLEQHLWAGSENQARLSGLS